MIVVYAVICPEPLGCAEQRPITPEFDSKRVGPFFVAKVGFQVAGVRPEAIQPVGARAARDGKTAFVALGPGNRVALVNGETYEVEDYLLVGRRVWQLAFTPDEKLLFTTNGVSNDVSVIDVEAQKVTKSIGVGASPGASWWRRNSWTVAVFDQAATRLAVHRGADIAAGRVGSGIIWSHERKRRDVRQS